ncbi:MAG: AI-2E family transporter, partial [Paludibacter sp.]
MVDKKMIMPFYAKAGVLLIGLSALLAILYIAQSIIVPIVFGLIIAILLNPIVRLFVRLKINRIIAICLTLLLTVIVIGAFIALIYTQALNFSESWPIFVKKLTEIVNQSIHSIAQLLHIRPWIVQAWITKTQHELLTIDGTLIGETIMSVGSSLAALFLIPVYVFVILYYQPLLIEFIHRLFAETHQTQVTEIVSQTKSVVQHYLVGLLIEAVIVGVLNTIGLMILGIQYAI